MISRDTLLILPCCTTGDDVLTGESCSMQFENMDSRSRRFLCPMLL